MVAAAGPDDLEDWKRLLNGRFEVRRSANVGRGAYAVVRRGRDLEKGKPVAVKFYVEEGDDGTKSSPSEETLEIFRRGISALEVLHKAEPEDVRTQLCAVEGTPHSRQVEGTPRSTGFDFQSNLSDTRCSFIGLDLATEAAEAALHDMRLHPRELFVEVMGYSRGVDGQPGVEAGMCYLVTEFGLETLEQYVADAREDEKLPSPAKVRNILLQLTQAVAALHAFGLTHLDIKPSNIMRFKSGKQSVWKLIDMDGLLPAHSAVDPLAVPFTPLYCPPELALAVSQREPRITVSRWMDVWCIGMSILDCILSESLLQARFKKEGRDAFLAWLGSLDKLELPQEVVQFDPGLARILSSQVLCPVAGNRASILELLLALRQPSVPEDAPPSSKEDAQLLAAAPSAAAASGSQPATQRTTTELPQAKGNQPSVQAYVDRVFPLLVPVIQHLLSCEAEDVEAEALRFLESQKRDREGL